VVFFVLPIIPLVIASVLAVLLMRVVNLSRYKDRLTLIGGILLLVIVMGSTYWMQENLGTDDPTVLLEQLLSQADGIVKMVGKVFPPSIWAAQAMAYGDSYQGWQNLLYLVLSGILSLGILYLLGEKVFMQGVMTGLEGSRGTGKRKKLGVQHNAGNLFMTLVNTERKLFLRDPNFALNGLVGYVLLPLMALLPVFGQGLEGNPFAQFNLGEIHPFLIMGGIAIFFMVMTSFSMIPSTTFSREGKYLWIIRTLPLSISQIIGTRIVAAQVVNTIGCLLGVVPLAYFFGWGVLEVLGGTAFGILLAGTFAFLLALLDLSRPMLDWVNPIRAVKSNFNAIIGVFGSLALAFLVGLVFFLNMQTGTLWLIPLELTVVTAILAAIARFLARNIAPKLWAKI
jgi:ABC-2 type transport system permease protein